MKFEISISDNNKIALCKVYVDATRELLLEIVVTTQALKKEHGIKRYLFDHRGHKNISTPTDSYHFINKDGKNYGFSRETRNAVLVDPFDNSFDFVQIVSKNAGLNTRLFDNENDALKWLNEDF